MNVAQKASPISSSNTNNQLEKSKALIEKLLQLGPNYQWQFQEQLKKLHSAENCQTETQIQIKPKKNKNSIPLPKISTENFKSPSETSTTEVGTKFLKYFV